MAARNQVLYGVVVNTEGQYSVWPLGLDIPAGWQLEGTTGERAECLAVISEIWTDLVPRSSRRSPRSSERDRPERAERPR